MPTEIEVDLADLNRDLSTPVYISSKKCPSCESDSGAYYVVAVRCYKPNCITRLNADEIDRDYREGVEVHITNFNEHGYRKRLELAVNYGASSFAFLIHDEETAGRVQRAMSHLIALGGGKAELF